MKSVLTVTHDDGLMNRIKLILSDDSIRYYYAINADDGANIATNNEIAVAIVDYNLPIVSGKELCEMLLSINPEVQIILVFGQSNTKEVIKIYNEYHINKLMCKEYLVLKDLPLLVDSCLHTYNRDDEINELDLELKTSNNMYLKPMQEMSSVLNERLSGYEYVINVFKKSFEFLLDSSEAELKTIDDFVDKLFNDYINIFMIKDPDVSLYFDRISTSFNKPDEKKYFRFEVDDSEYSDNRKNNLLFVLDLITIYFDVFYPHYRGKISVAINDGKIEINSIYEVRKNQKVENLYTSFMSIMSSILVAYSDEVAAGAKENIIQYRVRIY